MIASPAVHKFNAAGGGITHSHSHPFVLSPHSKVARIVKHLTLSRFAQVSHEVVNPQVGINSTISANGISLMDFSLEMEH